MLGPGEGRGMLSMSGFAAMARGSALPKAGEMKGSFTIHNKSGYCAYR